MKIAFIINSLLKKGPVIVAINLASQLSKMGHSVTVYYLKETSCELDIHTINVKKLNLRNILDLKKFDIVHSHSLAPDVINFFISIFFNVKTVSTVHNNIFKDLNYEYNSFKAFIIKYLWILSWISINKKICLTETALYEYTNKIAIKKTNWDYIYNSVDYSAKEKTTGNDKINLSFIKNRKHIGRKIIGSCAVITERKGLQFLIKIAKSIECEYDIFIIGDGDYKITLKNEADKLKLTNVYFMDKTQAPRKYMSFFDIYMMPSLSEGFGLAAIEASLEGCNLICSNILTFKEIFKDHIIYFDIDNPESLITAIKESSSSSNDLTDYIHYHFNIIKMSNEYLDVYKK